VPPYPQIELRAIGRHPDAARERPLDRVHRRQDNRPTKVQA
jgi:hypothetical protein